MKSLEETKEQIGEIMRRHGAVLGYVFGSYARGKMTPLSDVDVAVVFGEEVPKDKRFDIRLKIAHEIGKLLGIERVDVVDLKDITSPLLKHRATLRGEPVLVNDEVARLRMEHGILQEYEDTRYLRDINAYFLRRRFATGTDS